MLFSLFLTNIVVQAAPGDSDCHKPRTRIGEHFLGFVPSTEDLVLARMSREERARLRLHDTVILGDNEVPDELNWAEEGVMPPVKNQGSCGSCWAFAAADVLAGRHAIKNGENIDLSETHFKDCTYFYDGCEGGHHTTAWDRVGTKGVAAQDKYYKYTSLDRKCPTDEQFDNLGFERVSYAGLTNGKVHQYRNDVEHKELKKELTKYGPCAVALAAEDIWNSKTVKDSDYVWPCPEDPINHAVSLVGFGTNSKGEEYWMIKNSWGSGWGDNGFIRVSMKHCKLGKHLQVSCPEVREMKSDDDEKPVAPKIETCGGTAKGSSCSFPFEYKGKEYTSCTSDHHTQPWCFTENGEWGNCECGSETCGGTANGAPCSFPFTYKGKEYTSCTMRNHDQPWCYTENGGWGNCECDDRRLEEEDELPAPAPAPVPFL